MEKWNRNERVKYRIVWRFYHILSFILYLRKGIHDGEDWCISVHSWGSEEYSGGPIPFEIRRIVRRIRVQTNGRTSNIIPCCALQSIPLSSTLSLFIVDIERIFTLLSAGHYSCWMVSPFIVIPGKRVGERTVSSKEEETNKIYAKLKLKTLRRSSSRRKSYLNTLVPLDTDCFRGIQDRGESERRQNTNPSSVIK